MIKVGQTEDYLLFEGKGRQVSISKDKYKNLRKTLYRCPDLACSADIIYSDKESEK